MATLNSVVAPSRINYLQGEWSTTVKRWPNGRTTKKRNWSAPLKMFEVEWEALTLTNFNLLLAHFDAQSGQFGTFQFTDTHTNTTYNVQYATDKIKRENIKPNSKGFYILKLQLEEVR